MVKEYKPIAMKIDDIQFRIGLPKGVSFDKRGIK